MSGSMKDAALFFGHRAIPLKERSKLPAIKRWQEHRSTPEFIERWWTEHPTANVGFRTGGGYIVLDIDPRAGGHDVLSDLEHEHGELPETVTCETGGGGVHLYFNGPDDVPSFDIAPGVEIKAAGRQVVAPPSIHPETKRPYRWREGCAPGQIARAAVPSWLIAGRPGVAGSSRTPEDWMKEVTAVRSEGGRHNAACRLAGYWLRKYVDVQMVFDYLCLVNAARFTPPLPIAELEQIVDSMNQAELARRRREQVAA